MCASVCNGIRIPDARVVQHDILSTPDVLRGAVSGAEERDNHDQRNWSVSQLAARIVCTSCLLCILSCFMWREP